MSDREQIYSTEGVEEMTKYQFEGTFRDSSWRDLPSPDEVRASMENAIKGAHAQVFGTEIGKVDVTSFEAVLPGRIAGGYPEADVVVTWDVSESET